MWSALHDYFEAQPTRELESVKSPDDLEESIELYHTLVGRELYDEAWQVFWERLNKATLYQLAANRLRVDLLQGLFEDHETLPRLTSERAQSSALNWLAGGLHWFVKA